MIRKITLLVLLASLYHSCTTKSSDATEKIRVIFDTDANNELDDQHAMAYLFFNGATFDLAGVTVNATRSGKEIKYHMAEAERVMHLCGFKNNLPLYQGADSDFLTIQHQLDSSAFDGKPAVDFLIEESHRVTNQKTTVIAVGKLTNIALAIQKDPSVCDHLKIVWLGSNYPEPGEYNLENDTASVNYVFQSPIELEVVTVRYGKNTGSAFVSVTQEEVNKRMPGIGPTIESPVTGRHGGSFSTFGDYSVNLFEHIDYHGTPPARSLFDMVAVAIVKNPAWGQKTIVNGPRMHNGEWISNPQSQRSVTVWENFNKVEILNDYYHTLEHYQLLDNITSTHP